MTASKKTDVNDFLGELGGGVFVKKIEQVIADCALATVIHGAGGKKGKVTIELNFCQIGDQDQVIIKHKLSTITPTARGKKAEEDCTETPMFVGKGGTVTINAPREEESGQFALIRQQDGVRKDLRAVR